MSKHQHPYMKSSDYNAGKQIVKCEGVFSHYSESGLAFLLETVEAGNIWIPVSQLAKDIEIHDASTSECVFFIPRWLAESKKIAYEDVELDPLEEKGWDDRDSYEQMMGEKP